MSKAILPHKVGNAAIASPELKTVVMQFMENFLSLGGCVSDLQEAVRKLSNRRVVFPEIEDIEQYVAVAQTAAGRAEAAVETATEAATAAATQAATAAAGRMLVNSFSFCNLAFPNAATNYRRFYLSDLVADASKTYVVSVSFFWNIVSTTTSTTSYVCGIAVGRSSDADAVLPLDTSGKPDSHKSVTVNKDNRRQTCEVEISGSDSFFQLTNSNTTAVQITVKITPK
jgi:hypothetical protein